MLFRSCFKLFPSHDRRFVVCYGFEHARDTIIEYLNFKETGFSMKEHTKPLVRKMTDEDVKQFDTTGWR